MKQFNLPEYNRMCAEFLKYGIPITDKDFCFYEHPKYDEKSVIPKLIEANFEKRFTEDWNWIMEVVDKIELLPDLYGRKDCRYVVDITTDALIDNKHTVTITHSVYSRSPKGNTPIYKQERKVTVYRHANKKEAVVQAIWEFLNWYNQK